MKTIIGFAGRKRSGKGSLCEHLRDTRGATIITIANALKQLCCELICVDSIDELNKLKDNPDSYINLFEPNKHIWTIILANELGFDLDEDLSELYDMVSNYIDRKTSTVRELLQFIGTDVIRHFNPNWHVDKMVKAINSASSDLVVVDDVRFPNERDAISKLGGYNFFVIRPDLRIEVSNHSSETSLSWVNYDDTMVIVNMYDIETMLKAFDFYMDNNFTLGAYCPSFAHGAKQLFTENPYFGYKATCSEHDNQIISKYVLPNLDKTGAFVIHTSDESLAKDIAKSIYTKYVNIEGCVHTFTIWNPFIIENLKRWI